MQFVAMIGKRAARFVGAAPGTWLSSHIQLFVAFTVSGLAHVPGDVMLNPSLTGLSFRFFIYQAFAITLEDAVISAGRRMGVQDTWAVRLIGYAWTVAWFTFSYPIYLNWGIAAGLGSHRAFPGSLVRPVLELVAQKTGIDILGWVAQKCVLSL